MKQGLPETVSRDTLAKLLGVTVRVVSDLSARGIAVKTPRGAYVLEASVAAYAAHLRSIASGRGGDESSALNLTNERAKLAAVQAEEKALKVAQAKGELVEAEAVTREWMAVLQKVRAGLLAIPPRLQAKLRHLSAQDVADIDAEIRATLSELGRDE